jgi:hypothetical protein
LRTDAKAKHEPHRSERFCQTQIPHIGRAYGLPTPLDSLRQPDPQRPYQPLWRDENPFVMN